VGVGVGVSDVEVSGEGLSDSEVWHAILSEVIRKNMQRIVISMERVRKNMGMRSFTVSNPLQNMMESAGHISSTFYADSGDIT
jgi:hypothetical protein